MAKEIPSDPLDFLYKEELITLSSVGNIFTFGLVTSFRLHVFDKMMGYVLPMESFEFLRVTIPDIGPIPEDGSFNPFGEELSAPNVIEFGIFIREAIIWIFMIMILYILCVFLRFPNKGGLSFSTQKT